MNIILCLQQWRTRKSAWVLLAISAFALVLAALVFQHVYGHAPCIKCIYQRTAVIGILLAAIVPIIYNNSHSRFIGYAGWLLSAVWGWRLSSEHIDILTAPNPFFAPCEIVPNFPSMLPLHQWLPQIFAAPGDCFDQAWQFMGMGMPQWMQIIFAFYSVLAAIFIALKFLPRRD